MLSETFVSIILEASITGAGLILAIYALITPISSKIFEKRVELLRKKKKEFDKMKKEISSNSSGKEFKRLKTLASEIQTIKTFPKYLGIGVLLVFLGYLSSVIFCFVWFTVPSDSAKGMYEPTILLFFIISTIGFFFVGAYSILDVYQAMKEEYEQVKKEKEEVVLFSKKISLEEIMQTAEDTKKILREMTKNKRERETEGKTNVDESEQKLKQNQKNQNQTAN